MNENSNFSSLQGLFYSVLSCRVRGQCACCFGPHFQQRSESLHHNEKNHKFYDILQRSDISIIMIIPKLIKIVITETKQRMELQYLIRMVRGFLK